MRRARLTFLGAYHHIMNRGINGEAIFRGKKMKREFIRILGEKAQKNRIKILAYCIMDNHYHLILQNTTDRLSLFMKQLNSQYGTFYRLRNGGRGYVFQNRYKSTLIQEDLYLKTAIAYVLLNPVKAGVAEKPGAYLWSTYPMYFTKGKRPDWIAGAEVEAEFGSREGLLEYLNSMAEQEMEPEKTRAGSILGEGEYIKRAIKSFNRRKTEGNNAVKKRIGDYAFKSREEVIREYEGLKGISVEKIDTGTLAGKRQRSELLLKLKDEAGMKYGEILKLPLFRDIKYNSIATLYNRFKAKIVDNC